MHRHDLDLIAEYATGALADESVARALVESCEVCAREFDLQKTTRDVLAGIGTARLTDLEKAALHRDMWTELRNPAARLARTARPWWRNVAFATAAVLILVVGTFAALDTVGEDTVQTFSEIGSGLDRSGAVAQDGAGEENAPTEEGLSRADLYEATPYTQIARRVRVAVGDATTDSSLPKDSLDCLEKSGLEDHVLVEGFEDLTPLLIAVPANGDANVMPVSFIDPETCTVVQVEE